MTYLILCIIANVGIFLCFRQFKTYGLDTFQAIVFNYITCVATGLLFQAGGNRVSLQLTDEWIWIAVGLGFIFIGTFYMMALTTQRFSMTVSSIASKMSLIIPVFISLFILQVASKEYSLLNYLGMAMAFPAIVLSSIQKKGFTTSHVRGASILLPLGVFFFGGVIDTSINVTNFYYLNENTEPLFPIAIFASASCIGIITIAYKKDRIRLKNIAGGVALGVVNYFSIYCLIKALSAFQNDGALVYPVMNVGIILVSAVTSILVFKEVLSGINKVGLLLAVIAIIILSYQEFLALL